MSEPNPQPNQIENYKIIAQLTGALLSIIGGFAAVFIRARLDKKQEIEYIKISITDELNEICAIIGRLSDYYDREPHIISNDYLNELSNSKESFEFQKKRLYLINSATLRKDIVAFYKKLDDNIKDSINKVGSLQPSAGNTAHDQIATKFQNIATEAHGIEQRLSDYKYRLFWFNHKK